MSLASIALVLSTTLVVSELTSTVEPAARLDLEQLRRELGIAAWEPQTLVLPRMQGTDLRIPVRMGGSMVHLALSPHSVRAPGLRFFAQRDGWVQQFWPPAPRTMRGIVEEWPGSRVAASLDDDGLRALILYPGGEEWSIQPVRTLGAQGYARVHVAYYDQTLDQVGLACAVDDPDGATEIPGFPASSTPHIAELGVDADVDFYLFNGGSVDATVMAIEHRMNQVSLTYEAHFDLSWVISSCIVRTETGSDDPYSGYGMSFTELVQMVKNLWNEQHADWPRDATMLFTHKLDETGTLGLSISSFCRVCHNAQVAREGHYPIEALRTWIVAHELGHCLGASHCTPGPTPCHIMCGSPCSPTLSRFGPAAFASISAKLALEDCDTETVASAPPLLASVTPSQIQAFGAGPLMLSGSGFMDVGKIVLDWGTERIEIDRCNFDLIDDNTLSFEAPIPLALGPISVVVLNQVGPSNAVTLTYVETNPPLIEAQSCVVVDSRIEWTMAAGAFAPVYLLFSPDDTMIGDGGVEILANGQVIFSGSLDAVGLAGFSLTTGPNHVGQTWYSQLVVHDGAGNAVAASDVTSTLVSPNCSI